MILKATTEALAGPLAMCARFINRDDTTLKATTGILFEAPEADGEVFLTANDLAMSVQIQVQATAEKGGRFCVPGEMLVDLMKALPDGEFAMSRTKEQVQLECPGIKTSLRLLRDEEFPIYSEADPDMAFTCDRKALQIAVARVAPFASVEDTRPILCGLLLEPLYSEDGNQLIVVATNGTSLGRDALRIESDSEVLPCIIPSRAASELVRVLNAESDDFVKVLFSGNVVSFHCGRVKLQSRLIEGAFPDYRRAIPGSSANSATIHRTALVSSLKRARIMAVKDAGCADRVGVKFLPDSDQVVLSSVTEMGAQVETIPTVSKEGEEVSFDVRGALIATAIGGITGMEVTLAITERKSPIVVSTPAEPEYLAIVMPVVM